MKRLLPLLLGLLLSVVAPVVLEASPASQPPLYLLPAPGAQYVSPATSLALRQGEPFDQQQLRADIFSVTGSRSSRHTGTVRLSDDRLTLLFYPDRPFAYDETVTVAIRPGLTTDDGTSIPGTRYQFDTLQRPMTDVVVPPDYPESLAKRPAVETASPYVTYPEFTNVMTVTVISPPQNVADGFLFVTGLQYGDALMVDNSGEPVYIRRVFDVPGDVVRRVTDFKRQDVDGTPYLTYHKGDSHLGWTNGVYYVMDQHYDVVDTWTISNGYGADMHDLQLLDNGHALMASYTPIPVDLSPYGGPEDGVVIDGVIQEQDSAKNVVFEWHASQHIPLTDTFSRLGTSPVDYIHINALEVDHDGKLLVSSRNTSAVYKIDRQTGQVVWIMGGRRNDFTFTNDIGFSRQHDIRRLANGHITLFDNGNDHIPPRSRAVEYAINEASRTVTRVWCYPEGDSYFALFMGNVQRLDNGNTVIGWGAIPGVTEVRPDGSKAIVLYLSGSPYRAFRFPWDGIPAEPPRAAAMGTGNPAMVTLYFGWNGATQIDAYEVYAGPTSSQMTLLSTVDRTGFETSTTLTGLPQGTCVFKVRPVDHLGRSTPYSNTAYRTDIAACRNLIPRMYLPLVLE